MQQKASLGKNPRGENSGGGKSCSEKSDGKKKQLQNVRRRNITWNQQNYLFYFLLQWRGWSHTCDH